MTEQNIQWLKDGQVYQVKQYVTRQIGERQVLKIQTTDDSEFFLDEVLYLD